MVSRLLFITGCLLVLLSACAERTGISLFLRLEPREGSPPLTVDYDCFAQGGEDPVSYLVDFDDGEVTREPRGAHIFEVRGVYRVSCLATDATGARAREEEDVVVGAEAAQSEEQLGPARRNIRWHLASKHLAWTGFGRREQP